MGTLGCTVLLRALPEGQLVSGGHAPHILNMTLTENPKTAASDYAAAIARWDDEGGAAKTSPGKQDLPKQNGRRSIQKTPAHQAEIDHKQEASHATHPIGRG